MIDDSSSAMIARYTGSCSVVRSRPAKHRFKLIEIRHPGTPWFPRLVSRFLSFLVLVPAECRRDRRFNPVKLSLAVTTVPRRPRPHLDRRFQFRDDRPQHRFMRVVRSRPAKHPSNLSKFATRRLVPKTRQQARLPSFFGSVAASFDCPSSPRVKLSLAVTTVPAGRVPTLIDDSSSARSPGIPRLLRPAAHILPKPEKVSKFAVQAFAWLLVLQARQQVLSILVLVPDQIRRDRRLTRSNRPSPSPRPLRTRPQLDRRFQFRHDRPKDRSHLLARVSPVKPENVFKLSKFSANAWLPRLVNRLSFRVHRIVPATSDFFTRVKPSFVVTTVPVGRPPT